MQLINFIFAMQTNFKLSFVSFINVLIQKMQKIAKGFGTESGSENSTQKSFLRAICSLS